MAENGDKEVNGHSSSTALKWRVGLMNKDLKFLTAETFGHEINATAKALKKKQIWTLEQEPGEEIVYIRSGQNCYLSSDKYGKVMADSEERGDHEKFTVEYSSDGRWAFKQLAFSNYFSAVDNDVKCFDRNKEQQDWWSVQLYIHPQIHLRSVNRKRYARLVADRIECSELVPWGSDSLFFLDFVGGKYTLKTYDNRYLDREGQLVAQDTDDCKFTMEIHSGALTFKDIEGRYLTAVGTGALKFRSKKATKDEYFTIEDSSPQVQLISHHNNKSVSVKQGVDVAANQSTNREDIEDTEIFQMEYSKEKGMWAFRDNKNRYWSLQSAPNNNVQSSKLETTDESFFRLDWQEDGSVGIVGHDGKYLTNKRTGILISASENFEESNRFQIVILNRPCLVLKNEFGFVGLKGSQYICNKTNYDILVVEHVDDGSYLIKGQGSEKYWNIGDDNSVYLDNNPSKFKFQFCFGSMMAIRAPNGCFLTGEQNGLFKASSTEIGPNCLWEF